MSSTLVGVVTTIPFACMGAFSFLGPGVIQRFGTRSVLAWSLVLVGAGALIRAAMPSALLLILTTLPIGLGIALAGVTIPIVIKQYFSDRPGATMGAYTTAMSLGIMVVGLTAVPLADALGSWRDAFALSALPALLALPMWLLAKVDDHRIPVGGAPVAGVPASVRASLRPTRTGVYLGVLFGLQALCFASIVTWGVALYEDAGWSHADAALAISSLGFLTIVASLTVPPLSDRGERRTWCIATLSMLAAGMLGMAVAPGWHGGIWMILFGFGGGAFLPLCFALPLDLEHDPAHVGRLTAAMLGIGHGMAAIGPLLVGRLRDLSGGFELAFLLLFALAAADVLLAIRVPRGRPAGG